MRIRLVRAGGLAGMRRTATIDTETADPARAAELARLLREADLESLAGPSLRQARGADRFGYTLTVEQGAEQRIFRFSEEQASEAVQRLVEAVWREGSTEPPGGERA